jgi:hypothetical protein
MEFLNHVSVQLYRVYGSKDMPILKKHIFLRSLHCSRHGRFRPQMSFSVGLMLRLTPMMDSVKCRILLYCNLLKEKSFCNVDLVKDLAKRKLI